jgi:hypothetical protein
MKSPTFLDHLRQTPSYWRVREKVHRHSRCRGPPSRLHYRLSPHSAAACMADTDRTSAPSPSMSGTRLDRRSSAACETDTTSTASAASSCSTSPPALPTRTFPTGTVSKPWSSILYLLTSLR